MTGGEQAQGRMLARALQQNLDYASPTIRRSIGQLVLQTVKRQHLSPAATQELRAAMYAPLGEPAP